MQLVQMSCRDCGRDWWRTSWKGTPVRCPRCLVRLRHAKREPLAPLEIKECAHCGASFACPQTHTRRKYCSSPCKYEADYSTRCKDRGLLPKKDRSRLTCVECEALFTAKRSDAKYCSPECQRRAAGLRKLADRANIRRHGISPEYFDALLAEQGGTCAIKGCASAECSNGRRLHIDHDHACCPGHDSCGSCIRGLLCDRHNIALGMCQDDPAQLRALADYIERKVALLAVAS